MHTNMLIWFVCSKGELSIRSLANDYIGSISFVEDAQRVWLAAAFAVSY